MNAIPPTTLRERPSWSSSWPYVHQTDQRPVPRELAPCPIQSGEALGPIRKAAEAVREATRAPFAICAQSVLAAATLAVQPHRDVGLPGGGRKPLTGLFATDVGRGCVRDVR